MYFRMLWCSLLSHCCGLSSAERLHMHTRGVKSAEQRGASGDSEVNRVRITSSVLELTATTLITASAVKPLQVKMQIDYRYTCSTIINMLTRRGQYFNPLCLHTLIHSHCCEQAQCASSAKAKCWTKKQNIVENLAYSCELSCWLR